MEYTVGQAGRVIAMKLGEGEDLYESIESAAKAENIKAGAVFVTGGIREANVVVGPKAEEPKLEPDFTRFIGPGEMLGVGTIYCDDEGPKLHIHTSMGRGERVVTGCPRGGASVFLVLEVTIIEIRGINAARKTDEQSGLKLLKIEKG